MSDIRTLDDALGTIDDPLLGEDTEIDDSHWKAFKEYAQDPSSKAFELARDTLLEASKPKKARPKYDLAPVASKPKGLDLG